MNKHIVWDHVTSFSQLVALVLFVGIFTLGFLLGKTYEYHAFTNAQKAAASMPLVQDVVFTCTGKKTIEAVFFNGKATLNLSDGRNMTLSQALAASGARYANADESVVFWNKGTTATLTENNQVTYQDCATKPAP